jgi:hypothetical protein
MASTRNGNLKLKKTELISRRPFNPLFLKEAKHCIAAPQFAAAIPALSQTVALKIKQIPMSSLDGTDAEQNTQLVKILRELPIVCRFMMRLTDQILDKVIETDFLTKANNDVIKPIYGGRSQQPSLAITATAVNQQLTKSSR